MVDQGHNVSVSACCWRRCTLLVLFTDKQKANCVLCSYNACEILVFFW